MSNWIQDAEKEMEDKGTVGAFTKQAKDSGMTVQEFAMKVKENPSDYTETTRKRAQFALNMEKIAKQNKMAQGGETQGYNDKLNEDLGTRLGRESGYSQSLKDRRDESKAGNETLGRRAYSSVETMDKGDKMFMQGGKTQGYDDRDRESIGERNKGVKSQSLDSRMRVQEWKRQEEEESILMYLQWMREIKKWLVEVLLKVKLTEIDMLS